MPEAEVPLWVCVAARPALAQMKPGWGERCADHLRLELGPLATDAATELARRLLSPLEHIPAAALETLVAGTHGNPFLLSELVRGLKRDGIVRPRRQDRHLLHRHRRARAPPRPGGHGLARGARDRRPAARAGSARPPVCAAGRRLRGGRGRRRDVGAGTSPRRPGSSTPICGWIRTSRRASWFRWGCSSASAAGEPPSATRCCGRRWRSRSRIGCAGRSTPPPSGSTGPLPTSTMASACPVLPCTPPAPATGRRPHPSTWISPIAPVTATAMSRRSRCIAARSASSTTVSGSSACWRCVGAASCATA